MKLGFLNQSESRLIVLKGILCTVFGLICILTIFLEDNNFTILTFSLGTVTLFSGFLTLVSIVRAKIALRNFAMFHYEGITSFIIGALMLTFPETAVNVFMGIIGSVAVGVGLMQIALAFDLKTYQIKEGLLIYSGILTVFLGVILFNNPDSISTFLNMLLGVFFSVVGVYTAYTAYKSGKRVQVQPAPIKQSDMIAKPDFAYEPVTAQSKSLLLETSVPEAGTTENNNIT